MSGSTGKLFEVTNVNQLIITRRTYKYFLRFFIYLTRTICMLIQSVVVMVLFFSLVVWTFITPKIRRWKVEIQTFHARNDLPDYPDYYLKPLFYSHTYLLDHEFLPFLGNARLRLRSPDECWRLAAMARTRAHWPRRFTGANSQITFRQPKNFLA